MTLYMFYTGEHVNIDDIIHVVGHAAPHRGEWKTECRAYNDWTFRDNHERGRVMRTTGPATCLWCVR